MKKYKVILTESEMRKLNEVRHSYDEDEEEEFSDTFMPDMIEQLDNRIGDDSGVIDFNETARGGTYSGDLNGETVSKSDFVNAARACGGVSKGNGEYFFREFSAEIYNDGTMSWTYKPRSGFNFTIDEPEYWERAFGKDYVQISAGDVLRKCPGLKNLQKFISMIND